MIVGVVVTAASRSIGRGTHSRRSISLGGWGGCSDRVRALGAAVVFVVVVVVVAGSVAVTVVRMAVGAVEGVALPPPR